MHWGDSFDMLCRALYILMGNSCTFLVPSILDSCFWLKIFLRFMDNIIDNSDLVI